MLRMADTLAHKQEGRLRHCFAHERKETGAVKIGRQTGRPADKLAHR